MVESARQYAKGVLKRLYWLAPTLFLDPFDIAERYFGIMYSAPQWLVWVLLVIGFLIAGGLTYHELRAQKCTLEKRLDATMQKKEIQDRIGQFLREGHELKRLCMVENQSAPRVQIDDWQRRVRGFIREKLGDSYESRLLNISGMPTPSTSIQSKEHADLWFIVIRFQYNLDKFFVELNAN